MENKANGYKDQNEPDPKKSQQRNVGWYSDEFRIMTLMQTLLMGMERGRAGER